MVFLKLGRGDVRKPDPLDLPFSPYFVESRDAFSDRVGGVGAVQIIEADPIHTQSGEARTDIPAKTAPLSSTSQVSRPVRKCPPLVAIRTSFRPFRA
jgi:hypothetical protein